MNLALDHFTSRPGALLPGGFLFCGDGEIPIYRLVALEYSA
jgi:hypothetical protein